MADVAPDCYFAKGKRGLVFLRELPDGRTVLVKRKNPAAAVDTLANEARCTASLNAVGVGPRFISYDEMAGELVREYVVGEELRKWLPLASASAAAARRVLLAVLRQCKAMDGVGITKEEMTRPWKHIIVRTAGAHAGEAVLIDFERCHSSLQPKNVTQLCQFLASKRLAHLLDEKGIVLDKERLLALAKEYKEQLKKSGPASHSLDDIVARIEQVIQDG